MKLSELAPDLTPEQVVDHEIKIHVDWAHKKVHLVLVNEKNEAVIAHLELAATYFDDAENGD